MAHLGFLVSDAEHPRLAAVATALLVAPPHTFRLASDFVLVLVKLWVCAALAETIVRAAARSGPIAAWVGRVEARMPAGALAAAALAPVTAAALLWSPPQAQLFAQAVDPGWIRFAEEASRRVEPGAAVLRAVQLTSFAPLKLLSLPYAAHANPYVGPARVDAEHALFRAASGGDRAAVSEILRKYDVRWSVGASSVTELCGEAVALRGPGGIPLVRLRPECTP
jgi:hypothetical protein